MTSKLLWATGLSAAIMIGCGGTPPPADTPPPGTAAATAAPSASAAPTAAVVEPPGVGPIKMHPVARIHSLLDITATDGGIELRLGSDPGGGQMGKFRYAPLVNGVPDLDKETDDILHADTTGMGYIEIAGKRPALIYHSLAGFRSAAMDSYQVLDAQNRWQSLGVGGGHGIGLGIQSWSRDRLLEFRAPPLGALAEEEGGDDEGGLESVARLPSLRVLQGADKTAPSIPTSLEKRMKKEGFSLETFIAFRTGEVFVVGQCPLAGGVCTLLWRDDPAKPTYFVTESGPAADATELAFVGGTTLEDVRLRADDHLMRFDGAAWVLDKAVDKASPPDVWFGSPLIHRTEEAAYVRFAAASPWRLIEVTSKEKWITESCAIDPSGVLWKTEDEVLLSSKEPNDPMIEITESDLERIRKARLPAGPGGNVVK